MKSSFYCQFLVGWIMMTACTTFALRRTRTTTQRQQRRRRTIAGGDLASKTRYPYFVRLDVGGQAASCGASLIHPEFILTAAHCLTPVPRRLRVQIGAVDSSSKTDLIEPKAVHNFPNYDSFSVRNDVALIQIDSLLLGSNFTDTLPLLALNDDRSFLETGDSVTVVGLGLTEKQVYAKDLREVELKVVADNQCDIDYGGNGIQDKGMLCALDTNEDSCSGDSGGPLVVLGGDDNSNDVQVGIVSFGGSNCPGGQQAGVYAEVSFYKPWIDSVICEHADNPAPGCRVTFNGDLKPIFLNDTDSGVCRDLPGAFYVNEWYQFQRCDWLSDNGWSHFACHEDNEAWTQCPFTCHLCTYEADEDEAQSGNGIVGYTKPNQRWQHLSVFFMFVSSMLVFYMCGGFGCLRKVCCCCCCCCFPNKKPQSGASRGVSVETGHANNNTVVSGVNVQPISNFH